MHNSSDPLSHDVHNVNRKYLDQEVKPLDIKEHSDLKNFPESFWNSPDNQKKLVDWLAKDLNINKPTDWYDVTSKVVKINDNLLILKQIIDRGAGNLLSKYRGSVVNLITNIYPEFDWLPWRFVQTQKGMWDNIINQKKFVQWAGDKLNIKEMSDWYKVSQQVLFC